MRRRDLTLREVGAPKEKTTYLYTEADTVPRAPHKLWGFLGEDFCYLKLERRHISTYCVPDDIGIQREVFMRNEIAESTNRSPRDSRVFVLKVCERRLAASPMTNN